MMKNAFYFIIKAPFAIEIFTFLSELSGYVEKGLHKKTNINFKIYYVKERTTINYNTHIAQYLKK